MSSSRLIPKKNRIDRRSLLSLSCFGLTSCNLLSSLRANAGQPRAARDKSVLLLYMDGGPSHIDMYDLRPHAPDEIRGPVRPIHSSVPEATPRPAMVLKERAATVELGPTFSCLEVPKIA